MKEGRGSGGISTVCRNTILSLLRLGQTNIRHQTWPCQKLMSLFSRPLNLSQFISHGISILLFEMVRGKIKIGGTFTPTGKH